MPQRTISNAGGNFNATGTWVEGVVPTTSDFVVATATSGQLTVTANATVQYIDLTLYTNTLTINSSVSLTFGTLASSTSTFNAGSYNFLGTGTTQGSLVTNSSVARNMAQVVGSPAIPRLNISGNTTTLTSNINIVNLTIGGNLTINSNNINVTGDLRLLPISVTSALQMNGTTNINLVGTNTIYQTGYILPMNIPLVINTSGTITFPDGGLFITPTTGSVTLPLIYTNGTIVRPRVNILHNTSNFSDVTVSFDLNGLVLDHLGLYVGIYNNSFIKTNLSITNPLRSKSIQVIFDPSIMNLINTVGELSGWSILNNKLICDNLVMVSQDIRRGTTSFPTNFDFKYVKGSILELDPAYTHDIGNINILGSNITDTTLYPRLRSRTSGTKVPINLIDGTKSIAFMAGITDVNMTTNSLKSYQSTVSNSTNVVDLTTGGGVSGGAWTFVN